MTVKQLLLPRYEVIANYPNSYFPQGAILTEDNEFKSFYKWEEVPCKGTVKIENIDRYPHLFKPMPWWKYRKEEEMPKYLKLVRPEETYYDKIEKWEMGILFGFVDLKNRSGCGLTSFAEEFTYQPCTEEEYLANIKNK